MDLRYPSSAGHSAGIHCILNETVVLGRLNLSLLLYGFCNLQCKYFASFSNHGTRWKIMRDFSSQTSLPKSIRATSSRRNWERVPMAPFILLSIGLLEKSTRRYRISLHRVALKRINDVFRTKTDAKRTLREITILRQCHHPNIAALK